MSDHVAVMHNGRFEQVDTPRNLYAHPQTPFVARFVGDNNCWNGTVVGRREDLCAIQTTDGQTFTTGAAPELTPGAAVSLFIRPEAIIIAPEAGLRHLNRLDVTIKSILFDGANSRLLANPPSSDTELLIALPQNRQYDYIRAGDKIEIGWARVSGICFPRQKHPA